MISIFAQTTEYTPPAAIASWLECAFWLAAFIAAIAVAKAYLFPRKGERMPQPLKISAEQRMATHEELMALRVEFNEFKGEIKEDLAQMSAEAVSGRRRLHNDIEELPAKVIRLLRDTKGLLDK